MLTFHAQKQAQQKAETDATGAKKKKVTAAQLRVQKGKVPLHRLAAVMDM